ncbi:MAG: hypothetical protein M1840_005538 [Geoglossum simile]|nr:MAG: hypothetical protein M1840_005538 [Geoglossum simile]
MSGVGEVASVIAIIQISKEVVTLCAKYYSGVKNAKKDRERLCEEVLVLVGVLEKVHESVMNQKAGSSSVLDGSHIRKCLTELEAIKNKLDPGVNANRGLMRRLKLRSLAWPFTGKEAEEEISRLQGRKLTFSLALAADTKAGVESLEQSQNIARLPNPDGAAFNSFRRQHESQCLPDTRVDLLRQIMEWSANSGDQCIFWLNGMAGTGKSTIARTIAGKLEGQKRLGGSFFFSSGEGDLANATKFIGTLAAQLAGMSPVLKRHISDAIAEHPDVVHNSLRNQWEQLILRPIKMLKSQDLPVSDLVIVVDALDECGSQDDVRVIIQLLSEAKTLKGIRLRTLVTSRPEDSIQVCFRALPKGVHQDLALHTVPQTVIHHDISVFLQKELEKIRTDHDLPPDWPGPRNIELLVRKANGLFIYAATACRFIGDAKWLPEERLTLVFQGDSAGKSPTRKLDEIYTQVLKHSVIGDDCDEREKIKLCLRFRQIVGSIVILFEPLTPTGLAELLQVEPRAHAVALKSLHSILDISQNQNSPVRLLHPSFRDFLLDEERCSDPQFFVDKEVAHKEVTERCLRLLSKNLRRNVCNLHTPGALTSELSRSTVEHHFPAAVRYACLYWCDHLQQSKAGLCDDNGPLHKFLQAHFLHWLEAIALLGEMSRGLRMITDLQTLLRKQGKQTELLAMVDDAKQFLLTNRAVIAKAPLQTYASALVFSPKTSVIKKQFSHLLPLWIKHLPAVEQDWSPSVQTMEGHAGWMWLIEFSPDGQYLATASRDRVIKIWDTKTGKLQSTLEGHLGVIWWVKFSPDNQHIATAADDCTVRLWDAKTGTLESTLEGHSGTIWGLAYSPDGRRLASAADDRTVKIWNAKSGTLERTLKDHSAGAWWVTFSPDGQTIASASDDRRISIWDANTGALLRTLEGHLDWLWAVVLSPDGQQLATASRDGTVNIWDTGTGVLQNTLEGHSGGVRSVAFSPDGQSLVSVSDATIRLWDAKTGELQNTLKGHSDQIWSVAFSPDGQHLASASKDGTVKMWDTKTGALQDTLHGHSDCVRLVVFSPDRQHLVSASDDRTVKLWDVKTREVQGTLEGQAGGVHSVVFSPDRHRVASATDCMIKLWDTKTGELQAAMEGHSDFIWSVVFSPDGLRLASTSDDRTVRLWDAQDGSLDCVLDDHSAGVLSVAFSPNGMHLASASRDCTVKLWDTATGSLQNTLEGHSAGVWSVAFSPDARHLASASRDGAVKIWDLSAGLPRASLEGSPVKRHHESRLPHIHRHRDDNDEKKPKPSQPPPPNDDGDDSPPDTTPRHSHPLLHRPHVHHHHHHHHHNDEKRAHKDEKPPALPRTATDTHLHLHLHRPHLHHKAQPPPEAETSAPPPFDLTTQIPPQFNTHNDDSNNPYSIDDSAQWIAWNTTNILHFPPDRKPNVHAFADSAGGELLLAVGHASGGVTVLAFDTEVDPVA